MMDLRVVMASIVCSGCGDDVYVFLVRARCAPVLAALLKHEGSSALKAALNLLLRRGLGKVNVIPGLKGPKFGAALP